jgi:hypothetical protein
MRYGILLAVAAATIRAQGQLIWPPRGATTLVMGTDIANGIAPPVPASRVSVPTGEYVTMQLPEYWSAPVQWRKDGVPIPGATTHTLIIPWTTGGDAGLYTVVGAPFPTVATGIRLDIAAEGNLGNVSARVELGAGPNAAPQIVGFSVTSKQSKNLYFRVVGPTLKQFGIAHPAPRPQVKCYDAQGKLVTFSHIAVVGPDPATMAGTFPFSDEERPFASYDYGPFAPGTYTLHATDTSGTGGIALIEVYELP